jgi:hypothetical protein
VETHLLSLFTNIWWLVSRLLQSYEQDGCSANARLEGFLSDVMRRLNGTVWHGAGDSVSLLARASGFPLLNRVSSELPDEQLMLIARVTLLLQRPLKNRCFGVRVRMTRPRAGD